LLSSKTGPFGRFFVDLFMFFAILVSKTALWRVLVSSLFVGMCVGIRSILRPFPTARYQQMPLSDRQINHLKAGASPLKFSDGGGLHIFVTPQGSKLWRLAFRYDGKQKLLSLGPYPAISLGAARAKRDAAKTLLANGIDPSAQAKIEKVNAQTANANTFELVALEMLAKDEREGKAVTTVTKKRWLLSLVTSAIGNRPIGEISAAEILIPLRKVEGLGNFETAKRLRAFIGQVCRYAIATTRAVNDPTYGLKGALTAPKVKHMAAVTDWTEYSSLIRAIWSYTGSPESRAALKLMALLYPRPGELRMAEWREFDLDAGTWTIPAERTKMRRAHKKPLPSLAIEILQELQNHSGNRRLVFPATTNAERPLSENTMNAALRRMGFTKDEATSHGFRASASTLLNESGLWSADAIEAELAHAGADEIRRAYHRATYWDERVRMADWWKVRIAGALQSDGK
jgi:integrase